MSVSFDFVSRQQNSEETNQNQRSYFIPDENIYRTGTRCVFFFKYQSVLSTHKSPIPPKNKNLKQNV